MNEKLPQVIRENFYTKIKNWFFKIFRKPQSINYPDQKILDNTDENNKENFIQSIKIESKDKSLMLQKKLKEKQIKISDLTDQELEEMIGLYKNQIEDKKIKLNQYKKIIKNLNAT